MSAPATLPRVRPAPSPALDCVVAATALSRGAALLLGWHADRLPRRGLVGAAGFEGRGPFRLTAWAKGPPGGEAWFLAALQFDRALPEPGAALLLQAPGQPDRPLARWPGGLGTPEALAEALAAHAEGRAADIALFLADLAIAAPRSAALKAVLRGFLARAAEDDGAVEIAGRNGGLVVLQGWGHGDAVEGGEAILADREVARAPVAAATFSRPDIAAPASGLVEALTVPPGGDAALAPALYLVSGGRLRRRVVVGNCARLGHAETAAHLREMLPRLTGPEDTLSLLRRATRAAYAGVETVSRLDRPVAAALDLLVTLPGIGAYVAGWLLDPGGEVARVGLAQPAGAELRLDTAWTRVARPDVVAGFAADPRFAGLAGEAHGFAAFVPGEVASSTEGWHVSVELAGGEVGFLPARPAAGALRSRLRRVAASIDLHKPTGHAVVEGALAPLLAAAAAATELPEVSVRRRPDPAPTALLLALPTPEGPPAAALSGFLADPPEAGVESLVIVLGPAWQGAPLAALEAAAGFYGLSAGILIAAEEIELPEAWELGARAVAAERFLCLGGGGLEGAPGWRRALAGALAEERAAVAAPMLVYEDGSVRSLGIDAVEPLPAAPYLRLRGPGVGLPRPAAGGAPRSCRAVALEGAMVSASAHRLAGGFARFGLTAAGQEAGFVLRLAAAGLACRVLPGVAVTAPQPREPADPWRRPARLAEALALRGQLTGEIR